MRIGEAICYGPKMQISSKNKFGWTSSILDTSFNFTFHKKLGPESQFIFYFSNQLFHDGKNPYWSKGSCVDEFYTGFTYNWKHKSCVAPV